MALRHQQTNEANDGGDSTASGSTNCGGGGGVLPRDVLSEALALLRLPVPAELFRRPLAIYLSWRSLLSDPLRAGHPEDRLVAVSARGVFDEEADVELLDTSGSGGRVVRRVPACAGPSYPRNPPMRAHLGLILLVGKQGGQRLRVVDPATGAVSLLPDHGEALVSSFLLGRAASTTGEEGGEYKVLSVDVDHDLKQSCKVLTLGVGGGGGAWRAAQKPPAIVRCDCPWVAAVAKGVVYILAFQRRDRADWIAAFDLRTEQWRPALIKGPPAPGAVSSLTEMDDGRLAAVSGSFSDGTSSSVQLWLLMSCGDGEQGRALWEQLCTVPTMSRVHGHEKVEEPLWVLSGGRVAVVVWSPVRSGGAVTGERGCQDWVLRMYDPATEAFKDVARLSNTTDVAIGICMHHPC